MSHARGVAAPGTLVVVRRQTVEDLPVRDARKFHGRLGLVVVVQWNRRGGLGMWGYRWCAAIRLGLGSVGAVQVERGRLQRMML